MTLLPGDRTNPARCATAGAVQILCAEAQTLHDYRTGQAAGDGPTP